MQKLCAMNDKDRQANTITRLTQIAIDLSAEMDEDKLLEDIIYSAKELTNADAGTLYLLEDNLLQFKILINDSLGLRQGGHEQDEIKLPPVNLYLSDGTPNHLMIASHVALTNKTVLIEDAYLCKGFDFSGTRTLDKQTGYRSKSFLTVPMCDHERHVIGVLQLINAVGDDNEVRAFNEYEKQLAQALSSQAAIALVKKRLLDEQKKLFESFVKMIAEAIDNKSPHTGGHCRRVPDLTMLIARTANECKSGPLSNFYMDNDDFYALHLASWMHDCGKVTTPNQVMEKSKKLETIFDRIDLIKYRFELFKSEMRLTQLRNQITENVTCAPGVCCSQTYEQFSRQLDDDFDFLQKCNIGRESMCEADMQRVRQIGARKLNDNSGGSFPLLTDDEINNLCIKRGTLTNKERSIIKNHAVVTIDMLEGLPYPKYLSAIPEYAGGHHEHMDGSGYPKNLTREQMSIPARILGIADVFEALTAPDRPYKDAMKLSQVMHIMLQKCIDQHIDKDIFDLFVREEVFLDYADRYLRPEQIDEIDVDRMLSVIAKI